MIRPARSPRAHRTGASLVAALASAAALVVAAPGQAAATALAGAWTHVPPGPIAGLPALSAWSGTELLVFGRASRPAPEAGSVNVAAAYDPARGTWRMLDVPPGPTGSYEGRYDAVWTGRELLLVGPLLHEAYDPATDTWRRLPRTVAGGGIVVWTGRRLLVWGGGCCGDASSAGYAFDPAANARRALARSPLAPAQRPLGAWTGGELLLWVSDVNPAGGTWPASLARGAAYDPRTNTWRRLARPPAAALGGGAVWTGREVLVVAGGSSRAVYAYEPTGDRWRELAPLPEPHPGAAIAWTGRRLLVWGGGWPRGDGWAYAGRGLALDPLANRWSTLPYAPLVGRTGATAVWTGRSLILWGGQRPGTFPDYEARVLADGAVFTPAGRAGGLEGPPGDVPSTP